MLFTCPYENFNKIGTCIHFFCCCFLFFLFYFLLYFFKITLPQAQLYAGLCLRSFNFRATYSLKLFSSTVITVFYESLRSPNARGYILKQKMIWIMSCHKRSRSCPWVGKVPTVEIHGSEEIKLKRQKKRKLVQCDTLAYHLLRRSQKTRDVGPYIFSRDCQVQAKNTVITTIY